MFDERQGRASVARLRHRSLAAIALVSLALACSPEVGSRAGSEAGAVPVVTPSSAYVPFEADHAAQQRTFEAYVACATASGIRYEGPFTDSTGRGLFFRLAPGQDPTHAEEQKVSHECPQGIVGLFGTPIGGVHRASFERAASEFARCVRTHGSPAFPFPIFSGSDPVAIFWRLPFAWTNERFTTAVTVCVDPLRSYLFPG